MEYTINWNIQNKITANFALVYIGYRDIIVKNHDLCECGVSRFNSFVY